MVPRSSFEKSIRKADVERCGRCGDQAELGSFHEFRTSFPPFSVLPSTASMSSLETHLARLESLISAQNKRIDDQVALIYSLSQRNDLQALELTRLASSDRSNTRSIHRLSEKVFTDGEWAENGTSIKRWAAEQSWKKGEEGALQWEWMVSSGVDLLDSFPFLPSFLLLG